MEGVCTFKEMFVDDAFEADHIEMMHELLDYKTLTSVTHSIDAEAKAKKK